MASLNEQLNGELVAWKEAGLYRRLRDVDGPQGPRIRLEGRSLLNFSSNDYLGLANDPLLKQAAMAAIEQYGVGAGASRLVSGNLAPYRQLEEKLARFKNKEAAIVFGSGYAANVGTISALVGPGDVVILDKLDHASIIDGARQSGATIRVYPHKDLRKLEALLAGIAGGRRSVGGEPTGSEESCGGGRPVAPSGEIKPPRVLIVTETVFSMDGDLAPLAEIVALKDRYGAWLMIDEAHATGLYGRHRRGLAEALGVEDKIDVTLGTLSKALGCVGGYVAGTQTLIDYLRNKARSLIYSTALPPASVAAAAAAVDFVMSQEGHRRRDQLWRNVSELKHGLSAHGFANESRSAIVPIIIGDEAAAVETSRQLYQAGIFVPAIRYPTVPRGKARLRVTVTAAHGGEDLRRFLEVFAALQPPSPVRPPHAAALGKGRVALPCECYFVTLCTDQRRALLVNPAAARIVIEALHRLRDQNRIRLLGFVIMPDHVHVGLALRSRPDCRPRGEDSGAANGGSDVAVATLAEAMKSLKDFTSRRLHRECGISLPIWQEGHHEHLLRTRWEFEARLEYVHANPVRRGLVRFPDEYPFSTAHPDYQAEMDWAWLEAASA